MNEELSAIARKDARQVGLRYSQDDQPGITRRRIKSGFSYWKEKSSPQQVKDEQTLTRIRMLAIPPAWENVWICCDANGHLQATGRDAKGRKQYRYHAKWRQVRDLTKYDRMIGFGKALPVIRRKVADALKKPELSKEKVLACTVYLLENTLVRIGNDSYARENHSYGLTTMRQRHIDIEGSEIRFHFRGKSGIEHDVHLRDRKVAGILGKLCDLPGRDLFQYLDADGERHTIVSTDVNDYLKTLTGEAYTAKDFRTWAGTLLAAMALKEFEAFDSAASAKKNIVSAIENVARQLGNTPAICRKCYVHPAVIDMYLEGNIAEDIERQARRKLQQELGSLTPEEAAVLALLEKRLTGSTANNKKNK